MFSRQHHTVHGRTRLTEIVGVVDAARMCKRRSNNDASPNIQSRGWVLLPFFVVLCEVVSGAGIVVPPGARTHDLSFSGNGPFATTAPPPEYRVQRFVIFTTARSGSGWTIRMLDSHRHISCKNLEPLGAFHDKCVFILHLNQLVQLIAPFVWRTTAAPALHQHHCPRSHGSSSCVCGRAMCSFSP